MMAKIIKYIVLCCVSCCFIACQQTKKDEKIITVTIEPQRYFAEQLVDSLFKIVAMVPAGTSPETYDPSPVQMVTLSHSSAYFRIGYIGFEMEWIDKIRQNNPQLPIYDTSKGIRLIVSEEDEHDHEAPDHQHHTGIDPHIWSSPREARTIVQNMYNALVDLDPDHKEIFKQNLEKTEAEIAKTDSILTDLFATAKTKSFIIYHPALSYLARDYGLTQYCIEIEGKEPSPAQVKELIETVRETDTKTIFIQKEFDQKNAETIAKETGCKLIVVNPLSYEWSEELIRIAKAIAHE